VFLVDLDFDPEDLGGALFLLFAPLTGGLALLSGPEQDPTLALVIDSSETTEFVVFSAKTLGRGRGRWTVRHLASPGGFEVVLHRFWWLGGRGEVIPGDGMQGAQALGAGGEAAPLDRAMGTGFHPQNPGRGKTGDQVGINWSQPRFFGGKGRRGNGLRRPLRELARESHRGTFSGGPPSGPKRVA